MDDFDLDDDDNLAIEVACRVARRLLMHASITPLQIVAIGHALYALERMPAATSGASTDFGVDYRHGDDEHEEMKYISFRISEDDFEICTGGSVYNRTVGSDSISGPYWLIEREGHRSGDLEFHNIEDSVAEMLNLGARISVEDESSIDYDAGA